MFDDGFDNIDTLNPEQFVSYMIIAMYELNFSNYDIKNMLEELSYQLKTVKPYEAEELAKRIMTLGVK